MSGHKGNFSLSLITSSHFKMWVAYMFVWTLLTTPCILVPARTPTLPIKDEIKTIKLFMENITDKLEVLEENLKKIDKMDTLETIITDIRNNYVLSDVEEIKTEIQDSFEATVFKIQSEFEKWTTFKETNINKIRDLDDKIDIAIEKLTHSEQLLTELSLKEPNNEGIFSAFAARGMLSLLKEINDKINSNQTVNILTDIHNIVSQKKPTSNNAVDEDNITYKFNISGKICRDAEGTNLVVPEYCHKKDDGTYWALIQRRGYDTSVNFNRSWHEYREGFGDLTGDFWVGNEYLYQLIIGETVNLRIELEDFEGNMAWAEYNNFWISHNVHDYKLHIGDYTGNATDSLGSHNLSNFSTYDRKNDNAPDCCPCAVSYGGGWWYNSCFEANLNGVYQDNPRQGDYFEGIIWEKWLGNYSLKRTRMMIRY